MRVNGFTRLVLLLQNLYSQFNFKPNWLKFAKHFVCTLERLMSYLSFSFLRICKEMMLVSKCPFEILMTNRVFFALFFNAALA